MRGGRRAQRGQTWVWETHSKSVARLCVETELLSRSKSVEELEVGGQGGRARRRRRRESAPRSLSASPVPPPLVPPVRRAHNSKPGARPSLTHAPSNHDPSPTTCTSRQRPPTAPLIHSLEETQKESADSQKKGVLPLPHSDISDVPPRPVGVSSRVRPGGARQCSRPPAPLAPHPLAPRAAIARPRVRARVRRPAAAVSVARAPRPAPRRQAHQHRRGPGLHHARRHDGPALPLGPRLRG